MGRHIKDNSAKSDIALVEAIRQFVNRAAGQDYPTTRELARALGWTHERTREVLRAMAERGMIRPIPVWRPALDGRMRPSVGYMFIERSGSQEALPQRPGRPGHDIIP